MWDSVPASGIKPISPALEGGVLTTGPRGKSHKYRLLVYIFLRHLKYCPTTKALNGNNEVALGPKFSEMHGIWAKCGRPVPLKDSVPSYRRPHPLLYLIFSILVIRTAFPALPPHPSERWRQTLSHQLLSLPN